jgi:hypothetical protein
VLLRRAQGDAQAAGALQPNPFDLFSSKSELIDPFELIPKGGSPFDGLIKKSADKCQTCKECTENGHVYIFKGDGKYDGKCYDRSHGMAKFVKSTKFARAWKPERCAAARKKAAAQREAYEENMVKATTDKLAEITKAAVTLAKGQDYFNNCPKDLWELFGKQTVAEKEYLGPKYAGGQLSAMAGVNTDIPEYGLDAFGSLGEVIGKFGDITDVFDLIKGGLQPTDVATYGAGAAMKLFQDAVMTMARKVIEVNLFDSNVRAVIFDPTVDIANCIVDPYVDAHSLARGGGSYLIARLCCALCVARPFACVAVRSVKSCRL